MALASGAVVGRYQIKTLLGEGGMGAVYRAADSSLDRDVALKVLDPQVARDPERVHRFLQEARAASALNHPNIIAIHEAGESADGTRFIATELVEGRTLREMIQDGPLSVSDALTIASQAASALAAAHAAGIVHRDIKPENIMVRPDGYVKVLDFGLAKLTDTASSGAHPAPDSAATMLQTTAGVIMGTVAYMSPEQARALKVDVRTDCFSLGAVMFEMLTGRQPFTGATGTDVMVAILERDAPLDVLKREGLPPQLVWVIAKALEKNPELRHQSAADLRVDLERVRRDVSTGASYGDQAGGDDRPSVILRHVLDSDADAVAMYGLSRGVIAAAVFALVLMAALPFLYRQTLGAEQRAPLPEAAVELRARDVAEALGRPVDGRESSAVLGDNELRLEAIRDIDPEEVKRAVRDGDVAEWALTFRGDATATSHGRVLVQLTPDGRLRAFSATPATTREPLALDNDAALAHAQSLAQTHLGIDVSGYTREHAYRSGDGLTFDARWKNPEQVMAHDDIVRVVFDASGAVTLSRTLEREEEDESALSDTLDNARGVLSVGSVVGLFVFGIVVLVRSRRWSTVGDPLPLGVSALMLVGFLGITLVNDVGTDGYLVLPAVGILLAAGALPGIAGLLAWLRQCAPVRLHGAAQLAAGHVRSPAVAASIVAGLAGGAAMTALSFGAMAVALHLDGFGGSEPSLMRQLTVASPVTYLSPLNWIAGGTLLAIATACVYELTVRLIRPKWLGLPLVAIVVGVLVIEGDLGIISVLMSVLLVALLLALYARYGLAAVVVTVFADFLLMDLIAAKTMGGPVAGPRGTMLLFVLLALIALAAWAYAGSRMKAAAANLSSKSGIR